MGLAVHEQLEAPRLGTTASDKGQANVKSNPMYGDLEIDATVHWES